MEQTLQPDGQMWVDVGQIIREQIPDKSGNTLPPTLTTGSYEITDLSHHGAGTLFEGKVIYDKMYGDAAYGCALCCGYATIDYGFWYDPLGIPDLGTAPQGVQALDKCEDEYDDVSDSFYNSWTTGNSSVATADYYGTHTGTGLGSTTSNAHGELNANDVPRLCPLHGYNPSGGDNTTPTISGSGNTAWYFNGQSPSGYPMSITLTSSGGGSTQWSVTSGSTDVRLSSTTGAIITVTSSGVAFSAAIGDVAITASVTEGEQQLTSAQFYITTRTPYWLVSTGGTETDCDPTWGYESHIPYEIQDQLLTTLPSGIGVNESWITGVVDDYQGTNWVRGAAGGVQLNRASFQDDIKAKPPATCRLRSAAEPTQPSSTGDKSGGSEARQAEAEPPCKRTPSKKT
ncbi:MAG: hypothetical protein ACRD8A_03925 [Candidatus Acidiferrales bacterium]